MKKLKSSGSESLRERKKVHDKIEIVLDWASERWGVTLDSIRGNHRDPELINARALIAWICWKRLGLSKTECAKLLHMCRSGVSKAICRGAQLVEDRTFSGELSLLNVTNEVRTRKD